MKKNIIVFLISIAILFITQQNVMAKDNIYSLNKYQEEDYKFIIESMNRNQEKDGLIVGGEFLKEKIEQNNETYLDYQIIIGKYNYQGKLLWNFTYGESKEDTIDELFYTYDENGKIDGYGIILEKSYDIGEQTEENTLSSTIVKIDLDGKLVSEKETGINKKEHINKVRTVFNSEQKIENYFAIGTTTVNNVTNAILIKYDREFNVIWAKELEQATYSDIVPISQENKTSSFAIIKEKNSEQTAELVKYDLEGNELGIIRSDLTQYDSYQLREAENGFILYGITSEVKLKKGEKSYYLIKYNLEDQEEWESIGEFSLDSKKKIQLLPIMDNNTITAYFLEYINPIDSSMEVIELDKEGLFQKKVKKVVAEYYNIEDFLIKEDTLYFVGQINCPKDDTCDYDSNSLLIISDEDKVIEVQDSDSKNILLVGIILGIGILGLFLLKRKKSLS